LAAGYRTALAPLVEKLLGEGDLRPGMLFRHCNVTQLDDEDRVLAFEEKPRLNQWVNGGFFVFEPAFLAYLEEDSVLENSPLRRLAADRELHAFRHTGFWDCMDTYKDAVVLNDLWTAGRAPWRIWDGAAVEAS